MSNNLLKTLLVAAALASRLIGAPEDNTNDSIGNRGSEPTAYSQVAVIPNAAIPNNGRPAIGTPAITIG
jgi:hypothetical protein